MLSKLSFIFVVLLCLFGSACSPANAQTPWGALTPASVAQSLTNLGISGPLFIGFPTAGSGTSWADLSGAGNNITFGGCGSGSPSWVSPIGLVFVSASAECLNAPAALNPAQTLIVVGSFTGNGGQYQGPIVGNGNGSASGADGIIVGITAFSSSVPSGYTQSILCNSTDADLITSLIPVGSPVFLAAVFNPDRDYYNETNPTIMNGQTNCPPQTVGNYVIGGQASGNGYSLRTYLDGTIYAVAAFSGQATKAQILSAYYIMKDYLAKNGVVINGQTTTSGNTLILVGDSQTQQPGGMYNLLGNAFAAQTNPPISLISTPAISGNYAAAEITDYPYIIQGMVPVAGSGGLCVVNNWLGTVDIVTHLETAAQTWGYLSAILRAESQSSCKVIATTVNDTTGFDSTVQALNASIRQNWKATGAAYLDDLSSVIALGAAGSSTNDPCFADGVHKTVGCNENIVAPLIYNAIQSVLGPQDFSTAPVYTSAAAAAVATTAGSESTNTMTFTFAATPANCQVGNWITIAGTTPSGYSSTPLNGITPFGWWIITRSATQVTAYNDTAGLGAITVQGTGVCPEQQPGENYDVLNFTGNFTLLPCEGWTGQTKWFKSIGGNTPTLVPYSTETIDGASTLTMGANATVGLQSTLASTTGAGCNLTRVQ
jgi:hypothetical protein